jgi:SSS family solute:Na+ symporter
MTGLIAGFILGMCWLVVEIMNGMSPFADGTFLKWFATTSFTFVCIYLTLICSLLIVLVSLATPKPRPEQLQGITYGNATPEQIRETRESWTALDVMTTAGLMAVIIAIYIYFTG